MATVHTHYVSQYAVCGMCAYAIGSQVGILKFRQRTHLILICIPGSPCLPVCVCGAWAVGRKGVGKPAQL